MEKRSLDILAQHLKHNNHLIYEKCYFDIIIVIIIIMSPLSPKTRPAVSNKTFCSNGNVLYLCCPLCGH